MDGTPWSDEKRECPATISAFISKYTETLTFLDCQFYRNRYCFQVNIVPTIINLKKKNRVEKIIFRLQ